MKKVSIQNNLLSIISKAAKIPLEDIDPYVNLVELGIDSLLFTQIKSAIKNLYDLDIPVSQFFSSLQTIEKIGEYIFKTIPELEMETEINTESVPESRSFLPDQDTTVFSADMNRVLPENLFEIYALQMEVMKMQIKSLQNSNSQQVTIQPVFDHPKPDMTVEMQKNNLKESIPTGSKKQKAYIPFKKIDRNKTVDLSIEQKKYFEVFVKSYCEKTKTSKATVVANRNHLANDMYVTGFTLELKELVYPVVAKEANGSKITDLDGNEYIDFTMGYGSKFFGHNVPFINEAIQEELKNGIPLGCMDYRATSVAKCISQLTKVDRVGFYNSGTEAVMVAMRLARAATGKDKIVMFSGSYHGTFDGTLGIPNAFSEDYGAIPLVPGTPKTMVADLLIMDYGSDDVIELINKEKNNIAGILVEPVQSRRPDFFPKEFLKMLREITSQNNIALIFDEMITGFRFAAGGIQQILGIDADIITYGKVVGGGMPIGVVAGKRKYMDGIDGGQWNYADDSLPENNEKRTLAGGTFCQHPLSMAAADAVLNYIQNNKHIYEEINKRADYLAKELNQFFIEEEVEISLTHYCSLFKFVISQDNEVFFFHLINNGLYVWEGRTCFLSLSHTDQDIEEIIKIVKLSVNQMKSGGYFQKELKKKMIL